MANKKISQLTEVGNVGAGDLFAVSVPAGGPYITKSCEPKAIATYALNPVPSDIPTIGFTGEQNVFFDKSNWIDTSDAGTHAFVMVNKDNGQLTTGSGIGVVANGDNMGDCKATQAINMQGNDITGLGNIGFGNVNTVPGLGRSIIAPLAGDGISLKLLGYQDLILSGNRHVNISGQALDLVNTPISGDVTFTGGNVTVDPNKILYVNEINSYIAGSPDDKAVLSISGAARFFSNEADAGSLGEVDIDWKDSNIQYDTVDPSNLNYIFSSVRDGQTVTMYIENTNAATTYTPTFTSGTPNTVLWGGTGGPPHIAPNRTNVYTFAAIYTGIFASAITGYEY